MGVQLNAYRKHVSTTKPVRYAPSIELDIILDVLDGCSMKCPGCFVTKENKFAGRDLQNVYNITKQFVDLGFEANELFLGPTDMFATTNLEEVMDDPMFEKLVQTYAALTFTSTMMSDPKYVRKMVDRLMTRLRPWDKRFELFVVVDIEKYRVNDREYLDTFEENLQIIADINEKTDNKINVFLIANFYGAMFKNISITDLNKKIKKDYDAKFKLNPSFARSDNSRVVEKMFLLMRDTLERQIEDKDMKHVFLNMADVYFGGDTFHPMTYTDGRLFVAPFMYDFIPIKHEDFEVKCREDGNWHIDDIFQLREDLVVEQYDHAMTLDECSTCEFLPNCVARNSIKYMKTHNITKCIMPKKLFRASCYRREG